jgi:small RNA 2'-O-methyltransferase
LTVTSSIEHLNEDVAEAFAPVLLGNYAPRLLLLTTPCFDFNERFSAPGEENWGFADPTGRTTRIFRHEDHKFEWTADECVKWCEAAAEEWGYDVVIDGVGRSLAKDPWGRDTDGETLRASQTAAFRRREGDDWATRRAEKYAEWASRRVSETQQPHKVFATHCYEAHAGAQGPASREDIAAAVKSTIQDIGSSEVTIFEIWREDAVSTICGGWLEVLLDVLDNDEAFVLHKEGKGADDWKIELPGVQLQAKNPWQSSPHDAYDAWGESSESADSSETYDDDDDEEYDEEEEEYDGDSWDETEDLGWAASDSEGCSKDPDESDINTLKAWEEWRPAPGWLVEGSWE